MLWGFDTLGFKIEWYIFNHWWCRHFLTGTGWPMEIFFSRKGQMLKFVQFTAIVHLLSAFWLSIFFFKKKEKQQKTNKKNQTIKKSDTGFCDNINKLFVYSSFSSYYRFLRWESRGWWMTTVSRERVLVTVLFIPERKRRKKGQEAFSTSRKSSTF